MRCSCGNVCAMCPACRCLAGVDVVPVVETQTVTWDGTRGFSVKSEPVLNVSAR